MLEKSKELAIGEIIRQAGEIIRSADYSRLGITQKTGSSNFVTEYDIKVQKYLEAELKKVFPECGFLAEEEGQGENKIGEGYTFVIDPIDGTTNFMLGRRSSVVSVGLLKDGKPIFGGVYDPYNDKYYHAVLGGGAYCNDRRISVSDRSPQSGVASLGTSPYYKDRFADGVGRLATGLLLEFGDIRRSGSAALDICAIACGECDGLCEHILSPWDYTAGVAILREAGGICSDFEGNELRFDIPTSTVFASAASYDTIMNVIKKL